MKTREQGNLDAALKMFEQVIEWDEKNNNIKGKIDVMGHVVITYTKLADQSKDPEKWKGLRMKALNMAEDAIKLAEASNMPKGVVAIKKVQVAGASLDIYKEYDEPERTKGFEKALQVINQGLKDLPGSTAHKAWPANTKAKLEYALGHNMEAIKTLTKAETWLYGGYADEIKNDDQAELKLKVWLSGIHITFAEICNQEDKPILAKHYATSVLNIDDPDGILTERKKEAKNIIDRIKERFPA